MRRPLAGLLAAIALAVLAPAAGAHVKIFPSTAAPGDALAFTVVVPNEEDVPTTKVELKIPDGLIPFSFAEVPGWQRTESTGSNGALTAVTWTGSLPPGSYVGFSFMASTPDQPTTLAFPAVQTYADGKEVAWIGPADSDQPAPRVTVSADAPKADAGGVVDEDEGGGGTDTAATAGTASTGAATTAPATTAAEPSTTAEPGTTAAAAAPVESDDDSGPSGWIAIAIAAVAAVLGAAALVVALRRRSGPTGGASPPDAF